MTNCRARCSFPFPSIPRVSDRTIFFGLASSSLIRGWSGTKFDSTPYTQYFQWIGCKHAHILPDCAPYRQLRSLGLCTHMAVVALW